MNVTRRQFQRMLALSAGAVALAGPLGAIGEKSVKGCAGYGCGAYGAGKYAGSSGVAEFPLRRPRESNARERS